MLYTTFIRLCDEANNYEDCQEFIMNLGWQSWMDKAANADEIADDLKLIFELSRMDFKTLRKKIHQTRSTAAALYQIPLRTLENWESESGPNPAPYLVDLLRFTVFVKEKEGDDGYLGSITEQD